MLYSVVTNLLPPADSLSSPGVSRLLPASFSETTVTFAFLTYVHQLSFVESDCCKKGKNGRISPIPAEPRDCKGLLPLFQQLVKISALDGKNLLARFPILAMALLSLWALPVSADIGFIVRSHKSLRALAELCLHHGCTVVRNLDAPSNELFLITAPDTTDPNALLATLSHASEVVEVEPDQSVGLIGSQNNVTTMPVGLSDTVPVNYFGASVWDGYVSQRAGQIVRSSEAHTTFQLAGSGIVADIDTGVDPAHPALQTVLLPGYDFTRNQPNGSEMTDFTEPPSSDPSSMPAQVNFWTVAVLHQSTAAVLDGDPKYAAFGHGTMVMGVIHLVAPQALLMPLKAFGSNGSAKLSDIVRAIHYAVQNNAKVINMSFDLTTESSQLRAALDFAARHDVICVASVGNDSMKEITYPAAYTASVMGVASTSDFDARSTFSNFGDSTVWVDAPGEAIITTYPFGTYAAGWGTSFSAPFVSGAASLLVNQQGTINQSQAAAALAHAQFIGPDLGNGRLDIVQALQSVVAVK